MERRTRLRWNVGIHKTLGRPAIDTKRTRAIQCNPLMIRVAYRGGSRFDQNLLLCTEDYGERVSTADPRIN